MSGRAIIDKLTTCTNFEIDHATDFASNFKRAVDETNNGNEDFWRIFEEAGATLGRNLFFLSVGSQPDFLVLAGPAFNATTYEEGVCKGFEQESAHANQQWTTIELNATAILKLQKAWLYASIFIECRI